MQCPQCHGHSVTIKDGQKTCEAKGCTYISFHVITYENENRQFEGEKGTENRFTSIYQMGGNYQKETRLQKNFDTASKVIKNLVKEMNLSSDLIDKAQAKLSQILKLKEKGKEGMQEDKSKDRVTTSNKDIAGFCLWVACCDSGMPFKDVRIANQLEISKSKWENNIKDLEKQIKNYINLPHLGLEHTVLRVCIKKKIRNIEKNAMIKMIENVKENHLEGGTRRSTVAACVFYLIMMNSLHYNPSGNEFDMKEYLSNKRDDSQKKTDGFEYWTQTHFDCTFETMRKFKNENEVVLRSILPKFEGRSPEYRGMK